MNMVEAVGLSHQGRLKRTDLVLRAGEVTCLIGPNGSGKTSLLHALAGIDRPDGQVRIAGTDPMGLPPVERTKLLSFLPASRDLAWPVVARDLVALGLGGRGAEDAVAEALALFELEPFAERRVDLLSTGERSRVLIARALAPSPMLLLLDEPMSNLDPLWQLRLMQHLKRLARVEGKAMLIALHDLDVVRRYADRLLIMDAGAIAGDGDARTLLEGNRIPAIFGVAWSDGGWRALSPSEGPRSSR